MFPGGMCHLAEGRSHSIATSVYRGSANVFRFPAGHDNLRIDLVSALHDLGGIPRSLWPAFAHHKTCHSIAEYSSATAAVYVML